MVVLSRDEHQEAARRLGLTEAKAARAIDRYRHRAELGVRPRSSFDDFLAGYVAGLRSYQAASRQLLREAIRGDRQITLIRLGFGPTELQAVVDAYTAGDGLELRPRASFEDFAAAYRVGRADADVEASEPSPDSAQASPATAPQTDEPDCEPGVLRWGPPPTGLSAKYCNWNKAIAENLFVPDAAQRPLYLDVDTGVLEAIAAKKGWPVSAAEQDFIDAIRSVLDPTSGDIFRKLHRFHESEVRRTAGPPFIALLAATVLAASRMATDTDMSAGNYYGRLAVLVDRDRESVQSSFQHVVPVWESFRNWLDRIHAGRLGISTAQPFDSRTRIGYPLSQALLREQDRHCLSAFFHWAGLVPGDDAAPDELAPLLRRWVETPLCHLTNLARKRVESASTLPLVAKLVARELVLWTGEIESSVPTLETDRATPTRRTAPAWLWLHPKTPGSVVLQLVVPRPVGFPPELQLDTRTLVAHDDLPWYSPMDLPDPPAPTEWVTADNRFAVRFDAPPVAALTRDDDLGHWRQVRRVDFDAETIILATPEWVQRTRQHLTAVARPGWQERDLVGLPAGWTASVEVRVERQSDDEPSELAALSPLPRIGASLSSGLRLDPSTWLCYGEPQLQVRSLDPDPVNVLLDGEPVAMLPAGGGCLDLRNRDLGPGPHEVKVGGRTLHFTLREGSPRPRIRPECRSLAFPLRLVDGAYEPGPPELWSMPAPGGPVVVRVRGVQVIEGKPADEPASTSGGPA